MQFIKTLFWVLLAIVLVAFSYNNWNSVTVVVWQGVSLYSKLPVLVIGSFLLGFLPMWLVYRANRWRMKRRIVSLESRTKLLVTDTDNKNTGDKKAANEKYNDKTEPSKALENPAQDTGKPLSAD